MSLLYQLYNLYSIYSNYSNINIKGISFPISLPVSFPIYLRRNTEIKDTQKEENIDHFQIEKLLKWMKLFFDNFEDENDENETHKAFKKELYDIYIGINSDYIQYKQWINYNKSLMLFSSYRSKNAKDLYKKISNDIDLFNEGLRMYFLLFNHNNKPQ
jgi:hypothetical protein